VFGSGIGDLLVDGDAEVAGVEVAVEVAVAVTLGVGDVATVPPQPVARASARVMSAFFMYVAPFPLPASARWNAARVTEVPENAYARSTT
jgi:hypothetical protein